MKILFMIPKLSYSGAPKIMAWVANGLARKNHDVTIIVAYRSKCEQVLDKRVNVVFLNNTQSRSWIYRNTVGMLRVVICYRKNIKETKPDAIISFLDSISYVYIILNHLFWRDRFIVSERVDPYSRNRIKARVILSVMKKSSLIIFQTIEAGVFFKKRCHALNDCVIPNPIVSNDLVCDATRKRKKVNFSARKRMKIVSVGRLSLKQKRQDILIMAMDELKRKKVNYKLFIYGSGPDEGKIKSLIEKYSLVENVELMGQQGDIPLEIFDSDCFILTSDFEGIPNALAEAMSIGIPCISTDCSPGGARLLIEDGANGFLVGRRDYRAIADKVAWIGKHRRESEIIGDNAIKITDNFNEEKIINCWEKEILKVVEEKIEK